MGRGGGPQWHPEEHPQNAGYRAGPVTRRARRVSVGADRQGAGRIVPDHHGILYAVEYARGHRAAQPLAWPHGKQASRTAGAWSPKSPALYDAGESTAADFCAVVLEAQ